MPEPKSFWSFEKRDKRRVRRDPFESEFFTGEEETEESFGKTDALVREAIQNSLDARRDPSLPVRVRIALSTSELASNDAKRYLHGLVEHLTALKNEVVNKQKSSPSMKYMVVEDFNTRGLCGDPSLTEDPDPPDPNNPESFYWFWRNVGRSGKGGKDRGRWGLGKTVFPSCSKINTLFGLTVRATDQKQLLMGQAITKIHKMGTNEYEPEGFFAQHGGEQQMPFDDEEMLNQFKKDFSLKRSTESGLSIVVPYVFNRLNEKEILRSVIVHYFYPILQGGLVVDVEGLEMGIKTVSKDSIRALAAELEWKKSTRKEKKHAPPPFDLATWAIDQQKAGLKNVSKRAGIADHVPTWEEELIPDSLLVPLRERFLADEPVAIRVLMTIDLKEGGICPSHFDAFLQRDPSIERGEDHFVREGMTISRVSTLAQHSNMRGLVIIDEPRLSALLGDAEGPAHTEWGTGEARPEQTFVRWKRRITFVKNSLVRLIRLLSPPPDELDVNLLKDIFSIEVEADKNKRRRKKKRTPPPPPPVPPPSKPTGFEVSRIAGGFSVHPVPGQPPPKRLFIMAAYDVAVGNPKKLWSEFDFSFEQKKKNGLTITEQEVELIECKGNRLEVEIKNPSFKLTVTGFDPLRDLLVDCKSTGEVEAES